LVVSKYCSSGQNRSVLAALLAAGEAHVVFLAAAPDPDFEVLRQCIDDGDADAVQATRVLVVLVGEFAARVQAREDQLDARDLFLRVLVDRHAAAVVINFEGTVLVDRDVDLLAVTGQCFVDRVVDDLVRQVIWPRSVGIHARPPPDRFETAEDLDVRSIVTFTHSIL
jgi:hypothetical protein